MSRALRGALVFAALIAAAPFAFAADDALVLQPASKLWLTGSSTMHAYSSTATQLEVRVRHDAALWNAALPAAEAVEQLIRQHGVKAIDVTVGVAGMKSGKDGLDKNMSKALLAQKHPKIHFVLSTYEIADGAVGEIPIDAKGKVTVAGVERDVRMKVTGTREGDAVRLRGETQLLMSEFGIKPPTMMMGALRTADPVVVHFDLRLAAGTAAPAAVGEAAAR